MRIDESSDPARPSQKTATHDLTVCQRAPFSRDTPERTGEKCNRSEAAPPVSESPSRSLGGRLVGADVVTFVIGAIQTNRVVPWMCTRSSCACGPRFIVRRAAPPDTGMLARAGTAMASTRTRQSARRRVGGQIEPSQMPASSSLSMSTSMVPPVRGERFAVAAGLPPVARRLCPFPWQRTRGWGWKPLGQKRCAAWTLGQALSLASPSPWPDAEATCPGGGKRFIGMEAAWSEVCRWTLGQALSLASPSPWREAEATSPGGGKRFIGMEAAWSEVCRWTLGQALSLASPSPWREAEATSPGGGKRSIGMEAAWSEVCRPPSRASDGRRCQELRFCEN